MTQAAKLAALGSAGVATGFKNRIINGNMAIDQRNAGASVTQTTGNNYPVDRFYVYGSVSSKCTAQQNAGSVTPPTGFKYYLGITSSSAYTVGSSEEFACSQPIEGYNIADLGWGASGASSVTLSFWVRSSLTGTFGGSLVNASNNRSYVFSYTVSAANTWEQKSITITGDTTGTWGSTNGAGVVVRFGLGCGSTVSNTAGSWYAGNYVSATGATSVVGTNGATFYITGVQFEVGTTATTFDFRAYGTELALCQRYYEVQYEPFGMGRVNATPSCRFFVRFNVVKRATPTCAGTGSFSVSDMYTVDTTQSANQGASLVQSQTVNGFVFGVNSATLTNSAPFTSAASCANLVNTGVITASAEL